MSYKVGGEAEAKCLGPDCDKNVKGQKTTFTIREVGTLPNGCPSAKGTCPKCGRGLMAIGKKVI